MAPRSSTTSTATRSMTACGRAAIRFASHDAVVHGIPVRRSRYDGTELSARTSQTVETITSGCAGRTQHVDIARAAERDRRLVESLRLAEPAAVEELVASYGSRALRLAIGITRNHADAEEIVQDALWAVVRKIDTFTGGSAFSSWLYRIVANVAYDRLRGRRGRLGDCSLDELSALFDKHGE